MIKAKISKEKDIVRVQGKGNPYNLSLETATMVSEIHRDLKAQNPDAAAKYKQNLLIMLLGPGTPVWNAETEEQP